MLCPDPSRTTSRLARSLLRVGMSLACLLPTSGCLASDLHDLNGAPKVARPNSDEHCSAPRPYMVDFCRVLQQRIEQRHRESIAEAVARAARESAEAAPCEQVCLDQDPLRCRIVCR